MEYTNDMLKKTLKECYGYDNFRPGQVEIIMSILHGQDVLAVLPTGGGKSLCFQLPGLLLDGVTIVVSPLISLMQDQTAALCRRGISAVCINSAMKSAELRDTRNSVLNGLVKFLYVSPERLQNRDFLDLVMKIHIAQLAVDEAHCVSHWGRSFRPEYYQIADFVRNLGKKIVVSAFTATATDFIRQDILHHLAIEGAKVFVQGFDRPNLTFAVQKVADKELAVLRFLTRHKDESGIIYCSTRRQVLDTDEFLKKNGFNCRRYHGGLTPLEREKNQNDFINGESRIIVATNAFGMGIDKADVRFVLHYNMSIDLDSYYQEAGRAGRDGKSAECVLLYNPVDVEINTLLLSDGSRDERQQQYDLEMLEKMREYCVNKGDKRKFILNYFGQE